MFKHTKMMAGNRKAKMPSDGKLKSKARGPSNNISLSHAARDKLITASIELDMTEREIMNSAVELLIADKTIFEDQSKQAKMRRQEKRQTRTKPKRKGAAKEVPTPKSPRRQKINVRLEPPLRIRLKKWRAARSGVDFGVLCEAALLKYLGETNKSPQVNDVDLLGEHPEWAKGTFKNRWFFKINDISQPFAYFSARFLEEALFTGVDNGPVSPRAETQFLRASKGKFLGMTTVFDIVEILNNVGHAPDLMKVLSSACIRFVDVTANDVIEAREQFRKWPLTNAAALCACNREAKSDLAVMLPLSEQNQLEVKIALGQGLVFYHSKEARLHESQAVTED